MPPRRNTLILTVLEEKLWEKKWLPNGMKSNVSIPGMEVEVVEKPYTNTTSMLYSTNTTNLKKTLGDDEQEVTLDVSADATANRECC